MSTSLPTPSSKCFPIRPTICEINNKSTFGFDRQMIPDLGVGLKHSFIHSFFSHKINNNNNNDHITSVIIKKIL